MEKEKRGFFGKRGFLLLGAWISSLSLTLSLGVGDTPDDGISIPWQANIYTHMEQFREAITDNGLVLTLLSLSLYLIYRQVWWKKEKKMLRGSGLLSLFLAAMYVVGTGYSYGNRLEILIRPRINGVKTVVIGAGFWCLYVTLINGFYLFLQERKEGGLPDNGLVRLWKKSPLLVTWVCIMVMWLPHLIMRYPGAMSYDNWDQVTYYFGLEPFTTAQPIFHTWLFGSFLKMGMVLGRPNLGLFLFVLLQSLLMSGVLALTVSLMYRWKTPGWLIVLTVGIYCIEPYYAGYAAFPIKDFLYTAFYLLFVTCIMRLVKEPDSFPESRAFRWQWICAAVFMILCRKNGIYVYYFAALFIAVWQVREAARRKMTEKDRNRLLCAAVCLLLPLLLVKGTEGAITRNYQVEKDSPKEMFSLLFQQTARLVRDHGEELPEAEREIIAKVLDYENLPQLYSEMTADPVKTTYHAADTRELAAYLKVWLKQFFRYPLCYLEATMNQNYYIFTPDIDNIVYNKNCYAGAELVWDTEFYRQNAPAVPEKMQGLAAIAVSYYSLLTKLPVLGLLNNVAFYIILMFVLLFYMLRDKWKKELLAMLPLLVSFLFVIAAPQIQGQPRYAFPIIYAMPLMLAFYIRITKDREHSPL